MPHSRWNRRPRAAGHRRFAGDTGPGVFLPDPGRHLQKDLEARGSLGIMDPGVGKPVASGRGCRARGHPASCRLTFHNGAGPQHLERHRLDQGV
jgi:hypothetical protein